MLFKKIIFFCFLLLHRKLLLCSSESHFSIIGPLFAIAGEKYKAILNLNDHASSRDSFKVSMTGPKNRTFKSEIIDFSSSSQKEIEIDIPNRLKVGDQVKLKASFGSEKKEVRITIQAEKFPVFIQTDKKVYKPGETVKYRVITLNSDFKPLMKDIVLKIPTIQYIKNFKTNKFGVFNETLKISHDTYLGEWEFQTLIDNNVLAKQSIIIDNKPDPEIIVKVISKQHVISHDDLSKVQVKVDSSYSYGSGMIPVIGSAKLEVHIDNKAEKPIYNITPGTLLTIDLSFLKNKLKQQNETEILLKAVFIDEKTESKSFGSSKIIYKNSSDLIVDIKMAENYFTPEHTLNVSISVKKFDGTVDPTIISGESTQKVSVFDDDGAKSRLDSSREKSQKINFQNGLSFVLIETKVNDDAIFFYVKIRNKTFIKKIFRIPFNSQEYLQFNSLNQIEDNLNVVVSATKQLKQINYVIMGRSRIIDYGQVKNINLQNLMNFNIKMKSEMMPKSSLIVYYLNEYGEVIFNLKRISFADFSLNELKITMQVEKLYPQDELELEIETSDDSFVGIMAVNANSKLLGENDITQERVLNKFDEYKLGEKQNETERRNDKNVLFKNANLFVISNERKIEKLVSRMEDFSLPDQPEFEQNDIYVQDNNPDELSEVNKDWNSWIFRDFETKDGKITETFEVPEKPGRFILTGFSINREKGLTLSKPIEINSYPNYHVELKAPSYAIEGDVLKIEVIIMNLKDEAKTARLKISFPNNCTSLFEEKIVEKECHLEASSSMEKVIQLKQSDLRNEHFYIQLKKCKHVTLSLTTKIDSEQIYTQKEIIVKSKNLIDSKVKARYFDLRESDFNSYYFNFNTPDDILKDFTTSKVLLAADILGQSLEASALHSSIKGLTNIDQISPSIRAVAILDYLDKVKDLQPKFLNELKSLVVDGYHYIITSRRSQKNPGAFLRDQNDEIGDILTTAEFVRVLYKFKPWNKDAVDGYITKGLNYLVSQQKPDGKFETSEAPPSSIDNNLKSTALVLTAFMESKSYKSRYVDQTRKAIDFIKKNVENGNNTQTLATVAYALSFENKDDCAKVLKILEAQSVSTEEQNNISKYWISNSKDAEIEIASNILMAYKNIGRIEQTKDIITWLLNQRKDDGLFGSNVASNIALKALSELAENLHTKNFNLNIKIHNDKDSIIHHFNSSNKHENKVIGLVGNEGVSANLEGKGVAYIQVHQTYEKPSFRVAEDNNKKYGVKIDFKGDSGALRICIKIKNQQTTDVVDMKIPTPTGLIYDQIEDNYKDLTIKDVKGEGTLVLLEIKNIKTSEKCFSIKLKKLYKASSNSALPVEVVGTRNGDQKEYNVYKIQSFNVLSCI